MLHRGTHMEVGSVVTDHLAAPQRRYLTILFCDLVGYTALSERLDPEELLALQGQYQKLALTVMERYSGFVARFSGDGILVYFGYPTAHENDAERAVRAALELTEQMSKLALEPPHSELPPLAIRVGIHTGLVVVGSEMASGGRQDHSIVGEPANLAARLQADAPPNSVVLSSETLELVDGLFEFEHLGSRRFKGISRIVPVYKVNRARVGASRNHGRTRGTGQQMIGRTGPLNLIQSRWATVRDKSKGDAILVVGEAGVGKTRLVSEFVRQAKLADANIVQVNCHEIFAATPFYPVTGFLWAQAGIDADEDHQSATGKLASYLDLFGLGGEENIGIAASLLGFTTAAVADVTVPTPLLLKRKQVALLVSLFEQMARSGPTLLWVEDAHWIDPSSAEMIRDVIAQLANVPLFVALTARVLPAIPTFPVLKPGNVIMLEQLDNRECIEVARLVPGASDLSEQELSHAVDAADGIPLFIEQLVIAMVDQSGGKTNGGQRRGNLPLTLAEMMSERLDRFPNERGIIQTAACIGRGFTPDFLAALLNTDAEKIAEPLHTLTQAELLRTRHDGPNISYEFRHALLQRAAYDSILQSDRQTIHSGIVQHLTRSPDTVIPELLAHHLSSAGQHLNAIKAWLDAGTRAARRSAHIEAIEHLRHGLDQLPKIPAEDVRRNLELNLRAALIGSMSAAQGPTSVALSECCQRGLQLCNEEPSALVFPFLFGQITYVMCSGQTGKAQPLAELFLKLASDKSYDSGRVIGHRLVGMAMLGQGRAAEARQQLESSLALYDDKRDAAATHMFGQNFQVHSRSLLSLALFCTGDIDRALEVGFDALQFADSLRHPHSTALALGYVGGWVFGLSGAKRELMAEARRLITLSDEHRLGPFRVFGSAFLGWAQCQQGNLATGIATLQQATERLENVQFKLSLAGHLANLADAMRRNGRVSEAQHVCARAVRLLNEGGERWLEPEVLRVEALVARDWQPQQQDKAIAKMQNAVASARTLEFPIFELRCLMSLRDMLGPEARDQAVEERIAALAHLQNIDRKVAEQIARRMPEARA